MKWSRSLGYHRNAETVYSKRFFFGGGGEFIFSFSSFHFFYFLSFFTFIGETIQRKTDWTAFFQGVNCYALQSGSNYIKTKLLPPAMAEELCYIFYSLRGFVTLKWIIWRQSREYSRTYAPFIFPTRQRINTTWYAVSVQSESGNQHLPILLIVERFPI